MTIKASEALEKLMAIGVICFSSYYVFLPKGEIFGLDNLEKLAVFNSALGIFFLYIAYKLRHLSYSLFIIVIFYSISYVNRLHQVLSKDSIVNIGGHFTTGQFQINADNIMLYISLSTLGLLSLAVGVVLSKLVLVRSQPKNTLETVVVRKKLIYAFIIVVVLRLLLIAISELLGIGKAGISPMELPFKLTGIIVYLNSVVLPVLTVVMVITAIINKWYSLFNKFIICSIIVGIALAIQSESKAGLIFSFAPIYLFIINDDFISRQHLRKIQINFLLISALLIVSYIAVEIKRYHIDGTAFNVDTIIDFLLNYKRSNENLNIVLVIIDNVFTRITGGSELMAVIGSPVSYNSPLPALFYDQAYIFNTLPNIISDIFGVSVGVTGNTFVGKSIGLFGIAYLPQYIHMFVLMLLAFGIFVGVYEKLVKSKINITTSIILSFYLIMNVWEGGFDIFFFYLMLPFILVYFNKIISKKVFVTELPHSQIVIRKS